MNTCIKYKYHASLWRLWLSRPPTVALNTPSAARYLGHLRWRSIRARGVPMCSAVTWLRHATTCAHTVRLLSAHFDFSAIVYRCPIAIYPNHPYGYRIQKLLLFLRKLYFYSQFNIHLPISSSISHRSIVRNSLSKFTPTFTIRFVPD